jgi:hypothetical protein
MTAAVVSTYFLLLSSIYKLFVSSSFSQNLSRGPNLFSELKGPLAIVRAPLVSTLRTGCGKHLTLSFLFLLPVG